MGSPSAEIHFTLKNGVDSSPLTLFDNRPDCMIENASENEKKPLNHKVYAMTAGALPTSTISEKMENIGFEVMPVYGLTETYGHFVDCAGMTNGMICPLMRALKSSPARGVRYPMAENISVLDPETPAPMSEDNETMGEIMVRANTVMKGCYTWQSGKVHYSCLKTYPFLIRSKDRRGAGHDGPAVNGPGTAGIGG